MRTGHCVIVISLSVSEVRLAGSTEASITSREQIGRPSSSVLSCLISLSLVRSLTSEQRTESLVSGKWQMSVHREGGAGSKQCNSRSVMLLLSLGRRSSVCKAGMHASVLRCLHSDKGSQFGKVHSVEFNV